MISISGEKTAWGKVVLDFETSENFTENASTFRDYRLDVTFTNPETGTKITVPGFFAADGNAAETSATSGNVWRVNFNPPEVGNWQYEVSFRTGNDIAAKPNMSGSSADAIDGQSGNFTVTEPAADSIASKGMLLQEEGTHYLRFQGNGDYFIKGGPGVPENLLAYDGFDNTDDGRHDYSTHLADAEASDPTWQGGEGKALLGAINYIAEQGLNTVYFLLNSAGGDGRDVMPWANEAIYGIPKNASSVENAAGRTTGVKAEDFSIYDVSKLAQWERVFDHMDDLGIYKNILFQETENDQLLNGGTDLGYTVLSVERVVYMREMIARFGHSNMLQWNLGEENTNTAAERADMAEIVKAIDPYDHLVVIHSYPLQIDEVYSSVLGVEELDGTSFQTSARSIRERTLEYKEKSAAEGDPWVLQWDEDSSLLSAIDAYLGDPDSFNEQMLRTGLWGHLTAGGTGVSWYLRATEGHGYDQNVDTFDGFESIWGWTSAATSFFNTYVPFWNMEALDGLTVNGDDFVMADPGETYLVYLPVGEASTAIELNLSAGAGATFQGWWYDPRNGGNLIDAGTYEGGGTIVVGSPPKNTGQDWVFFLERAETSPYPAGTVKAEDGLVVLEAEDAVIVGNWVDGSGIAGHTGDGAVTWPGPNRYGKPIEDSTLVYNFVVEEGGDYYLSVRSWRPDNDAAGDQNNDFWVKVDDGPWMKMYFHGERGQWVWAIRQEHGGQIGLIPEYALEPGLHTVYIEGRSIHTSIDRLHFNLGGFDRDAGQPASELVDTTRSTGPKAISDEYSMLEDGSILIDPLANDSLPDELAGFDVIGGPGNGTLTPVDDGFRYTPNSNFFGQDRFVYEVTDTKGQTATAAVVIDVANTPDAPWLGVLEAEPVPLNLPGAVVGKLRASDPDGDELTLSLSDARFEIRETDAGLVLALKQGVSLGGGVGDTVSITVSASDGTHVTTRNYTVEAGPAIPGAGGIDNPGGLASLQLWFDPSSTTEAGMILDLSGMGNHANGATGAAVADGWAFNGGAAPFIEDAYGLNLGGPSTGSTLAFVFTAEDVQTEQVLWEQGGQVRGMSVVIKDGALHLTAWNLDASQEYWGPVSVSTAISAGQRVEAMLTLDASTGTLEGQINGTLFGKADGVGMLYTHTDDIGLGAIRGQARDSDGEILSESAADLAFTGVLHEMVAYDRALSDTERAALSEYFGDRWGVEDVTQAPFDTSGPSMEKKGVTLYGFGIDDAPAAIVESSGKLGVRSVGSGSELDYRRAENNSESIGADFGELRDSATVNFGGMSKVSGASEAVLVSAYDALGQKVDSFVFNSGGDHVMQFTRPAQYATIEVMDWIESDTGYVPDWDVDVTLGWIA